MLLPWYVELFGGLRVSQPDRTITRFRSHKTAALLAYLSFFRDHLHSREVLIEQFWPEAYPDAGRHSLNVSLTSLRRQLEPPGVESGSVLMSDRNTVGFNPRAIRTDVAEFEEAVAYASGFAQDGQIAALARAADMYRGDLLPGFYEPWVLPQMLRLEDTYIQVVRRLVQLLEAEGCYDAAIGHARRAAAFDPENEEIQAGLVRLYEKAGRKHEARALIEGLRIQGGQARRRSRLPTVRNQAVGLNFADGLVQVGNGSDAAPPVAVAEGGSMRGRFLPVRLTQFFGRAQELGQLSRVLGAALTKPASGSGRARLITLTGTGGSGKTRLALEAADCIETRQPGAVLFVPLATLTDASAIPSAIADALRLALKPRDDPMQLILDYLNGCMCDSTGDKPPAVLILDNFEHLIDSGAGYVRTLLDGVRGLTCLVTSRQPLELEGERVVSVGPLETPGWSAAPARGGPLAEQWSDAASLPDRWTATQLLAYPGVALFVDRAKAARPDFQVTRRNAAAVAALCDGLEGIPLAVELAAARIGIMTAAQMVSGLDHRFDLLVSRRRDSVERHRTMRAAIEWSYRLLPSDLRPLFARLSIFRGGWTVDAARDVCEEPDILDRLDKLRVCSLIRTDESPTGMRFGMLETLREFASEQVPAVERPALGRRHMDWFLRLAERHKDDQRSGELTAEFDNCRAALAWCDAAESDAVEEGLRLAIAINWGHSRPDGSIRGSIAEARRRLESLLARERGSNAEIRAKALGHAFQMAFWQGDYAAAARYQDERVEIYRASGDVRAFAIALQGHAAVAMEQANYDLAERSGTEALALSRQLGDDLRVGMALIALGEVARIRRDYARARPLFEEAVACARGEDPFEYAYALASLAYVSLHQNDWDGAVKLFKDSLAIWRDAENAWGCSIGLIGYGGAITTVDPECAARLFGAAETIRAQTGFPMQTADRADYEVSMAALREELDDVTLAALWAEGAAMSYERAVAHALGEDRK